ncbi:hypothetical protein VitviT2T_018016 [Vitis vinifera]|uniref:Bulb-type lectin domain-containing protein n=1 Tax=Vitis vinifera TaxID=29760 RepID=A0ABY9CWN4_VITVI|nr:hypothetical protein VitviT2T_018016 [Vitis vinifera]
MLSTIFFLCSVLYCSARDTITPEDWLRNDGGTLVSVGKTFELGFFNSDGRFNNGKYIGIWYYLLKPQRVVWVANQDSPLPLSDPPSGVFAIKDDGKLKLLDENGKVHWSSNTETSLSTGMVMKLMDSGNLVLSDNRSGEILWESFHNLTDTFLPGMWMDDEKVNLNNGLHLEGEGVNTLQGKRYMVTFIMSHYKHKVSLQHSVTLSTDTIEGTNW